MQALIRFTRSCCQWLTTEHADPSRLSRLWRGILLVPIFGLLVVLLRIKLALGTSVTLNSQTINGQQMRCRLPDLIQMYITVFGVWEPDLTHFIGTRLQPNDVFIDVGANIGYFSLLASQRVGPQGKVVAIDALPSNFAELQHNISGNPSTENIRAINRAVSDEVGTLQVYAGPSHNVGLATTAPGQRQNLQHEASIEAAPLSDLLSIEEIRQARVLKIDVEGAEPAVLAGMGKFLEACQPNLEILVELSPGWWTDKQLTPEQLVAPFRAAGFNTYLMDNNYWPWRYLWPNAVRPARRVTQLPDQRVKRIDLVLSKTDAAVL